MPKNQNYAISHQTNFSRQKFFPRQKILPPKYAFRSTNHIYACVMIYLYLLLMILWYHYHITRRSSLDINSVNSIEPLSILLFILRSIIINASLCSSISLKYPLFLKTALIETRYTRGISLMMSLSLRSQDRVYPSPKICVCSWLPGN